MNELMAKLNKGQNGEEDRFKNEFALYKLELEKAQVEIEHFSDVEKKSAKKRYKEFGHTGKTIQQDYKLWKKKKDTEYLKEDEEEDPENPTEEKVIQEGRDIIQQNKESLNNVLSDLNKAHEIGASTNQKIVQQNEQLSNVKADLVSMQDTLSMATEEMKIIGRKIMCDKYLWVLLFFIVAAIIAVLLVQKFKK